MKRLFVGILLVALTFGICFAASPEKKAVTAARNWLELIDGKNYAKSYDDAASFFKAMVKKDDWIGTLGNLRSMLGPVESRQLVSKKYETKMPGAPDGEYVILVYKTRFGKKSGAQEVVVPMLDQDGKWRVSGYYIK